jgi:poly-gamma-glutamate synthase PgsB/CapB
MAVCAKTTGTLARMILPDATEYPIFRPAGANVIEQVRIVSVAASYGAKAIVVECMALQPQLQSFCELHLLKSTHGVITNARADHLEVMGPSEADVALALCGTTPPRAKLFTAEGKHLGFFESACADRETRLVRVTPEEISSIRDDEMEKFSYVEHKENVALALRVCSDVGLDRDTALRGMWKAPADPGVMTAVHIGFFGRDIYFVNGFAANDPESTEQIWEISLRRYPDVGKRIIIFNCRGDRPYRSEQLGKASVGWRSADHYILIGSGAHFLARAAISEGLPVKKIISAEHESEGDIFERTIELAGRSALVVGLGNTKGQGLSLARYFLNRSTLRTDDQEQTR